jgi:hypothetical protein
MIVLATLEVLFLRHLPLQLLQALSLDLLCLLRHTEIGSIYTLQVPLRCLFHLHIEWEGHYQVHQVSINILRMREIVRVGCHHHQYVGRRRKRVVSVSLVCNFRDTRVLFSSVCNKRKIVWDELEIGSLFWWVLFTKRNQNLMKFKVEVASSMIVFKKKDLLCHFINQRVEKCL